MTEAGSRFESYVRAAMEDAGLTLAELARQSGIAASAWHGWFRGDRKPRHNSLKLASGPLRRTPEQLAAAWDGKKPPARQGATEAPEGLAADVRANTSAIAELVALLRPMIEDHESRLRAVEAELRSIRALLGGAGSRGRSAPQGSAG